MHWPLEAPQEFLDMFSKVPDNARQHVCAMAKILDEGVGNITAALKSKGIYEETIQIFSSDNGGMRSRPSSVDKQYYSYSVV